MILGLSMGCCHKFITSKNKNDILTLYRENFADKINAIEIVMPPENIDDFKINHNNQIWVLSLKKTSYHLNTDYNFINFVYRLQRLFNIQDLICHSDVFRYIGNKFWNDLPWFFLCENLEYEHNDDLFNSNYICFDLSHALLNGIDYLRNFYNKYKENIKQIHLSNTIDGKCHQLFYNNPDNFFKIKKIIDLKQYPIIIENSCENLDELKKEVDFIYNNI